MNIAILVDNPRSWFVPFARELQSQLSSHGVVQLLSVAEDIEVGTDIAFLLSSEKKVVPEVLHRSRSNIVVHASELPKGRGMSPLTWQVLEGRNRIPVTLFEAVEAIDAGPIYLRDSIHLNGNELLHEMHEILGAKIVGMCVAFADRWPRILEGGVAQAGKPSFFRRRSAEDSRIDPHKSLAEQFNLLRVVDNSRYPAFVDWLGRRFIIKIEAAE